jgi:hypothetical protein
MASQPSILARLSLVALLAPLVLGQGNNNGGGNTNTQNPDDDEDATTTEATQNTRTTARTTARTTGTTDSAATTSSPQPSGLPTGGTNPTGGSVGDLPTLTNFVTFNYPPPTVPPTVNAPFMQHSSLPNGTVFIAVGAILGTFGLAILVWRAIVACLLHRSVERAAHAQHAATEKSAFLAPPASFYKNNERESSPSVAAGRGVRRTTRGPTPSATPSQTNLFFSPTAAGSSSLAGRDSRYMPSGFYAAASGQSPSPNPHGGHSLSLTNLRPDSRGGQMSRNTMREPSPDGSPQMGPAGPAVRRDMSMSQLSLNRPPSQRAPSAYLEDLLDENPHLFPGGAPPPPPPPHPAMRHSHTFSHSSQSQGGRY